MSIKICLNLLILCGILCQAIVGTFLEDNHNNSSYILIRKKRIVDNTVTGNIETSITDVPYIVKVLQNETQICTGIIVSPEHILTAKVCADEPNTRYSVESGEPVMTVVQLHNAENIIFKGHLALLVIRPYIILKSPSLNRNIILLDKPIYPRTTVSIDGWTTKRQEGNQSLTLRRSSYVPIIRLKVCSDHYKKHQYVITEDDICVQEASGKISCTHEDGGSALVLCDKLVGVLVMAGNILDQCGPDVFIRVNDDSKYRTWIMRHIQPYINNGMHIPLIPNLYPSPQHPQNQYSHPQTSYNQYSHTHTSHNQNPHTSQEARIPHS